MIAHILRHSGYGCNAFLGGIAVNYDTNFWSSANNVCVIEADEYDRSFLKLNPDIAIITAMDADHLDIYGDEQTMQNAFIEFGSKVKTGGLLISRFGLKQPPLPPKGGKSNARPLLKQDVNNISDTQKSWPGQHQPTPPLGGRGAGRLTYSLQNEAADVCGADVKIKEGGYQFNVRLPDTVLSNVELKIGGMHNVENAIAAIAVANALEIDDGKIKAALEDFKGVRRRFEYIIPPKKTPEGGYVQPVLVDDYAHHPEELKALLNSVRSLFPQRVVTVIFQPHLFSRTRDFGDGFAEALSLADRIILLPIYPAREAPLEGVTSELILKKIDREDKQVLSKEELLVWMKSHARKMNKEFGEVIVMAGAGDIDALVPQVKEIMIN
jgi:UDP-N-acetylmuramate--alanine ligase